MSTTEAPPVEQQKPPADRDERLGEHARLAAILRRPGVGATVAALLVFFYFSFSTTAFALPAGASTWIFTSSSFAIMAVAVALLMIGGEFDLSAGAMTGTTGLITGIMMSHYHANVWVSILERRNQRFHHSLIADMADSLDDSTPVRALLILEY